MQKILSFFDNIVGILIAIFFFGEMLQICGLNIWKFPLNIYGTDELLVAQESLDYIYYFLTLLGIILIHKQKHAFLQKIEMILWIILFLLTPYLLHRISSIEQAYFLDRVEILGENHD